MITTAEQLTEFLREAVLGELSKEPQPATREAMAWAIGMSVKTILNRLKAMDYLPLSFQYKDITVDFDRMHAYPKFRVTVQPA